MKGDGGSEESAIVGMPKWVFKDRSSPVVALPVVALVAEGG